MGIIFNRKSQKQTRQDLRTHGTRSEALLWLGLRNRQMEGLKFRRQHGIFDFIVDFYCPELKLAIEIDGISHDSPKAQEKDGRRQSTIESAGVRFLRVRDEEVNSNVDRVLATIREEVLRLRSRKAVAQR